MDGWVSSLNRKTHQRKLNRLVRQVNKNIENDSLWLGRFFIRQYASSFERYEDGSGGTLYVVLRFYDKKDKKYQEYYADSSSACHLGGSRLWWTMNSFITEITSTWKEGHPKDSIYDYRTVPDEDVIKVATPYNNYALQVRFL